MTNMTNTAALEGQMSAAFTTIGDAARLTAQDFADFEVVVNDAAESFKALEAAGGDSLAAIAYGFDEMHEHFVAFGTSFDENLVIMEAGMLEMVQVFDKTKGKIDAMAVAIDKKRATIDKAGESIGKIGSKSGASKRDVDKLAAASAGLLANFGPMPAAIGRAVQGVVGLQGAMVAAKTTSKAMALTMSKALGPIGLIITGVMSIISLVRAASAETEETMMPSFDGLIRRGEGLTRESDKLSRNLEENIRLMRQMNMLGASDGLLQKLSQENEYIESQIDLLNTLAGMTYADAISVAVQRANESIERGLHELQHTSTINERGRTFEIYTNVAIDETELEWIQRKIDSLKLGIDVSFEDREAFREVVLEYMEIYDLIRNDPIHAELAQDISVTLSHVKELGDAFGWSANEVDEYANEITRLNAVYQAHGQLLRYITDAYRDTYHAADSIRGAHYALSSALEATNGEYYVSLDAFNEIMNLSPEYLNFLFDEEGGLLDVEDAVNRVTQAQIELMGIRQANAILDAAEAWQNEMGSLYGYAAAIDNAAESLWDLVEARLFALKVAEMEAGGTGREAMQVAKQIETMRNITESAQEGARANGTLRGEPEARIVPTSRGGALLVSDPVNTEIRGEFIRMREDVARRKFAAGVYQLARPSITVNVGGINENIYANKLSDADRNNIIHRSSEYCAKLIEEAYQNDLLKPYA